MSHELIASVAMLLEDDPQKMAQALAATASAWATFAETVGQYKPVLTFGVNETRTRLPKRAPRKPRIVPTTEAA